MSAQQRPRKPKKKARRKSTNPLYQTGRRGTTSNSSFSISSAAMSWWMMATKAITDLMHSILEQFRGYTGLLLIENLLRQWSNNWITSVTHVVSWIDSTLEQLGLMGTSR